MPIFLLVTCPDISDPIVVVQFTWQLPHPFTVRALYDLRVNHHNHIVNVYVISPGQEVQYTQKAESDFLIGLIDKPFQWSTTTPLVAPADLHVMWKNNPNLPQIDREIIGDEGTVQRSCTSSKIATGSRAVIVVFAPISANVWLRCSRNISADSAPSIVCWISCCVGQMSRR